MPSTRAPGITSCMRLSVRSKVDLPQPDGPMNAVTLRGCNGQRHVVHGVERAVVDVDVLEVDALGHVRAPKRFLGELMKIFATKPRRDD